MGVQWLKNDRDTASGQVNNYNMLEGSYAVEMFRNSYPSGQIDGLVPYFLADNGQYAMQNGNVVSILIGDISFVPQVNRIQLQAMNEFGNFVVMTFDTTIFAQKLITIKCVLSGVFLPDGPVQYFFIGNKLTCNIKGYPFP